MRPGVWRHTTATSSAGAWRGADDSEWFPWLLCRAHHRHSGRTPSTYKVKFVVRQRVPRQQPHAFVFPPLPIAWFAPGLGVTWCCRTGVARRTVSRGARPSGASWWWTVDVTWCLQTSSSGIMLVRKAP